MWFLAPPSACTRFPAAPALALQRSSPPGSTPRTIPPPHPDGRSAPRPPRAARAPRSARPAATPPSRPSSTTRWCVSGSCSLGLSTTVFPRRHRIGPEPHRDHHGEVVRGDHSEDPDGLPAPSRSPRRERCLRACRPSSGWAFAAACSTFSIPRCTSPHVLRDVLAVFARRG